MSQQQRPQQHDYERKTFPAPLSRSERLRFVPRTRENTAQSRVTTTATTEPIVSFRKDWMYSSDRAVSFSLTPTCIVYKYHVSLRNQPGSFQAKPTKDCLGEIYKNKIHWYEPVVVVVAPRKEDCSIALTVS
jgi:hypothetical protein